MVEKNKEKFGFLGMRVFKTSIAVFLSFLVAYFRGTSPLYSTIAALISMKTDHKGGIIEGRNRITGTLLGGLYGFIGSSFINLIAIDPNGLPAYFLYSLFLIPIIYSNVLLKATESVSLSSVIFIGIVLSDSSSSPIMHTINRSIETLIGVIISILINFLI